MKYIDADLLCKEIEKRLKNIRDYMNGVGIKYRGPKYHKAQGKESAYDALLSIIVSLQQEQSEKSKKDCNGCPHCIDRKDQYGWHFKGCFGGPYKGKFIAEIDECPLKQKQDVDLEEAAMEYIAPIENDEGLNYINFSGKDIKEAFIAGADWQKEQDLAEMDKSKSPLSVAYANRCFENGKQAMKEQMLREAVEGEVCGRVYDHINVRFADGVCKYLEPKNISHIPADVSKYNIGDKVRIIIVKEE